MPFPTPLVEEFSLLWLMQAVEWTCIPLPPIKAVKVAYGYRAPSAYRAGTELPRDIAERFLSMRGRRSASFVNTNCMMTGAIEWM